MVADLLVAYESRHVQTYGGLKQLVLNFYDATAVDTIDLATLIAYKNTKTIVDAATAKDYDTILKVSDVTSAKIRYVFAVVPSTGAFLPVVASSTATLTLGDVAETGLSDTEIEMVVMYK
jgi:hypothetical protein